MIVELRHRLRALKSLNKGSRYTRIIEAGMPVEMIPALEFLLFGKGSKDVFLTIREAEKRRREIASEGEKKVPIWYSPKPGSSGDDTSVVAQPKPGQTVYFTMERISKTGKDQKWGAVLYLIAKHFKSTVGIELGSCVGISAIFISSVPSLSKFITIEGSKELSDMARVSLKDRPNTQVVNDLFDNAIDDACPRLDRKLDFAFIDGHHEKVATIHYFNKLLPYLTHRAVVVFDDISWSLDMREAWDELKLRQEFAHCFDLGPIGVCLLKGASDSLDQAPRVWDLQPLTGKMKISSNPREWDNE